MQDAGGTMKQAIATKMLWLGTAASAALAAVMAVSAARAADMPLKAPPPVASAWDAEFGARYWYSWGRFKKDLFDPFTTSQLNSRLTYSGMNAHAGELYGRVDNVTGLFLKAYAGLGTQDNGTLKDEDFPTPFFAPYSATSSDQHDGKIRYFSGDVGYSFWRQPGARLGAFIGFHYFYEKMNAFGCTQTATNPFVCAPAFPTSVLVLSETAKWKSLRLGLAGDMMLTDRLKVTAEAAYLPYVKLDAIDNHWLRPEINPLAESGNGWGVQLEAFLSYMVTDAFNVGVGGRYWHMQTDSAHTKFPGAPPSPMDFKTERYGVFLQGSYKFGGPGVAARY